MHLREPNVTFTDCEFLNNTTAMRIGPGTSIRSIRTRYSRNQTAVENDGTYESHDDSFD